MNPYEVEKVTQYGSNCPNCGCEIYYSDASDLLHEVTVVTELSSHIPELDGYEYWEEMTSNIISTDVHQCECSCSFSDPEDFVSSVEEEGWVEERDLYYVCSKCETHHANLAEAKNCCVVEVLSQDQLVAQLFGRT